VLVLVGRHVFGQANIQSNGYGVGSNCVCWVHLSISGQDVSRHVKNISWFADM